MREEMGKELVCLASISQIRDRGRDSACFLFRPELGGFPVVSNFKLLDCRLFRILQFEFWRPPTGTEQGKLQVGSYPLERRGNDEETGARERARENKANVMKLHVPSLYDNQGGRRESKSKSRRVSSLKLVAPLKITTASSRPPH